MSGRSDVPNSWGDLTAHEQQLLIKLQTGPGAFFKVADEEALTAKGLISAGLTGPSLTSLARQLLANRTQ